MPVRSILILVLLALTGLSACTSSGTVVVAEMPGNAEIVDLPLPGIGTQAVNPIATATDLPTPTQTQTATKTPTETSTPGPYDLYSINFLRQRAYGDGNFEILEVMDENSYFTRYRVRYTSDGLDIYGFMNIPRVADELPVIIAIHGYIDPTVYNTLDYTTRYADDLARRGFAVIHPNLRNYPPSAQGENLFRVGMAIDILNLVAILRSTAGLPGPLEKIDADRIGLWGHSMGGGISTRVITVDPNIRAALLYAGMSGDEAQNFAAINAWSDGQRGLEELEVPSEYLESISPKYYFADIQSAVSIHHGLADELVPVGWSQDTCAQLKALGKIVECVYYKDMTHTFWGSVDLEFMENAAKFFRNYLVAVTPVP